MTTRSQTPPLDRAPAPQEGGGRRRGGARSRGITLVEVLITLAIMSLLTGMSMLGMGLVESARLKRSAIMISSAVRVAYAHANATSKTVRLVFDFEQRTVTLEESTSRLAVKKGTKTGGAAATTEAERIAEEEAERIMKGPSPQKPQFAPAKAFGFDPEGGKAGKELESGVRFLQIETEHQDEPEFEKAYLYFWPGGQTERASIQLVRGRPGQEPEEGDIVSVTVAPLTGKAEITKGRVVMARPQNDREESDHEDTGF